MTLRTAFISLILFIIFFFVTVALFVPVQVLVGWGDKYIPENFTVRSSEGVLVKGSVVMSSELFEQSLPVDWKSCFIDFLRPIGFCLSVNVKNVDLKLKLQPWSMGEEKNIYDIRFDTDIAKVANLHPALSTLGLAEGNVLADVKQLELSSEGNRILGIDGDITLTNASAIGLNFGTVNVAFSGEATDGNDENTIVIALEGGKIDEIKLQGSGSIDPQGNLRMRILFRTNNASVQQQLSAVTKKVSDTEYELDYAAKIF